MTKTPSKMWCYIDIVLFAVCQLFYCYPFIAESEIIHGLSLDETLLGGYIGFGILQIFISVATFIIFYGTFSKKTLVMFALAILPQLALRQILMLVYIFSESAFKIASAVFALFIFGYAVTSIVFMIKDMKALK